ncbi:hypothetical protein VPH35_089427 [Triticum aestivum]
MAAGQADRGSGLSLGEEERGEKGEAWRRLRRCYAPPPPPRRAARSPPRRATGHLHPRATGNSALNFGFCGVSLQFVMNHRRTHRSSIWHSEPDRFHGCTQAMGQRSLRNM